MYQYLGFPHTDNGINFEFHLNTMARKSEKFLNALRQNMDLWPEPLKMTIFNIYNYKYC